MFLDQYLCYCWIVNHSQKKIKKFFVFQFNYCFVNFRAYPFKLLARFCNILCLCIRYFFLILIINIKFSPPKQLLSTIFKLTVYPARCDLLHRNAAISIINRQSQIVNVLIQKGHHFLRHRRNLEINPVKWPRPIKKTKSPLLNATGFNIKNS